MKKIYLLSMIFFFCLIFSISLRAQILFSTTTAGGKGVGTINRFLPATNNLEVVKYMEAGFGGYPIYTSFIQATDGKLYGMTSDVIFSFNPLDSTSSVLNKFDGINGALPRGSLMQASDGKLYGMTSDGGSNLFGVIFSFDATTSTYLKLKDFDGIDAGNPQGSLVQASDGKLYGMTLQGGNNGGGVIFSFDPITSVFTTLKDFDFNAGAAPVGSLIPANDGKLYGMTSEGGSSGYGVIFSFDPLSSAYVKLKDFDGTNGGSPYGSLMQANDHKLYGMTIAGGSNNNGVIFSFDPVSFNYVKLKDFDYTNGANPAGDLVQASDGKLYGITAQGGVNNAGVIFSFDPSFSMYAKLMDFDITNGSNPAGSLVQTRDGTLYGMTTQGRSRRQWYNFFF